MYKALPASVKSSITRSITKVFETYMAEIEWKEDLYRLEDFMKAWQNYLQSNAQWNEKVPPEAKVDPLFHEEVANKINVTIHKILTEEPSEDQIARIEAMQQALGSDFSYSCRAEAAFVEKKLMGMKNAVS
jgi:hypothetical protein